MLDKIKTLIETQKKIEEMKRQLDETDFEITSFDGLLKIKMSGSQEVRELNILSELSEVKKVELEKVIKDTYNRAIKRAQHIAAEKMKNIMGFDFHGLI